MKPLRQKMFNSMRLRRFSPNTQEAYISAVSGLAKYYMKSPDLISQKEIEDYILYLITDRKLAQSTCHVAIAAIRFFYNVTLDNRFIQIARGSKFCNIPYSKKETHLPQILSKKELDRLFGLTKNLKHRALLMTTYSAGLRVSEVINLKVTDIESDRMMIRVDQGKGKKDRYTLLSTRLLPELRKYYQYYNPITLLFPGADINRPLTRHSALNIYTKAKKRAGLIRGNGIHSLRHCFATHLIEAYCDPRTIQELMGHRRISTTLKYMQVTHKRITDIQKSVDLLDFIPSDEQTE